MYEARDLGFKSCSSGFVVPVATSRTKGDSKPGLKPVSILETVKEDTLVGDGELNRVSNNI
jgi:hypothetical protein